jgi:methylphosphotriester-DNA--protein-cysteine methyltransferase
LFADGLSLALVGYLQARYTATDTVPPARHSLAQAQIKLVAEFVEAQSRLEPPRDAARGIGSLSRITFTRLFRTSFGMTPHAMSCNVDWKRRGEC